MSNLSFTSERSASRGFLCGDMHNVGVGWGRKPGVLLDLLHWPLAISAHTVNDEACWTSLEILDPHPCFGEVVQLKQTENLPQNNVSYYSYLSIMSIIKDITGGPRLTITTEFEISSSKQDSC